MRKAAFILLIAITMLTLNAASIRALSRGEMRGKQMGKPALRRTAPQTPAPCG